MAEDIIVEPILCKNVRRQIGVVVPPVVGEFFWTKHQDSSVAKLIILDDSESCERFPQANAVRQNAAVVCLQLVDDPSCCILLEVEQLVPDKAVLIARQIIWQYVFVDIFQKILEDIVKHQEVDPLW